MSITEVFFDIDRCLIDDSYEYTTDPKDLIDAINLAKSTGISFSINSNRSLEDILPFYHQLGFNGRIIGEGGSFLYDAQQSEIITSSPTITDKIEELKRRLESQGVRTVEINTSKFVTNPKSFSMDIGEYALVESSRKYTLSIYCRTIEEGGVKSKPEVLRKVTDCLNKLINPKELEVEVEPQHNKLLVSRKGYDKSTYMPSSNQRERLLAVGDSLNDLPMLEAANISAAPSNAVLEVKERVDYVADRPITEGSLEIVYWMIRDENI